MGMHGNAKAYLFDPVAHAHLTPWLAGLQAQCITHDRMIGFFMTPLSNEKLLAWWKDRIAETKVGTRIIIILLNESDPGSKAKGDELVGVVMLAMPHSETSPFRARVESLLISTKYRKRGGAVVLMKALHIEANRKGKTLLMTETESGSGAESVFIKMDYTVIGRVPQYCLNPAGELRDGVFLYKNLNA
ncbi:Acetyltransferase [Cytospora mali]|uniref:Acetyltransferase n=1 Tax=Cytospora mali TaxID=578113 RepID=A0A194V0M4_CYTMA|nr:Acetyltransferase [Valsa mali var. pyri (nom. inval.)]